MYRQPAFHNRCILSVSANCILIEYRPYLNTDLPGIVSVWKQQRSHRAFSQVMYNDLFERTVLSKPYFEHAGLIVALRDKAIAGFVHCGFGPNELRSDLDYSRGIICLLLTLPIPEQVELCDGLIAYAEDYLRKKNSTSISTGTVFPHSPFYLGLYGGSNVPGILSAHHATIDVFEAHGYSQQSRILVMQRSLHNFQAVLDRQQTVVRRSYRIEQDQDPLASNWWEACTLGNTNRSVFQLIDRKTNQQRGNLSYWDIEPLARNWGVRAMGLFDLSIEVSTRQTGLGTFLAGESLRCMQQQGINLVEAQVADDNLAATSLFEKMGFEAIDTGIVLCKQIV